MSCFLNVASSVLQSGMSVGREFQAVAAEMANALSVNRSQHHGVMKSPFDSERSRLSVPGLHSSHRYSKTKSCAIAKMSARCTIRQYAHGLKLESPFVPSSTVAGREWGCVGSPVPDGTRRTPVCNSSYLQCLLLCKQHELQMYSFYISFLHITSTQLHSHFS